MKGERLRPLPLSVKAILYQPVYTRVGRSKTTVGLKVLMDSPRAGYGF